MGGDGGSIPQRMDLVRHKKKNALTSPYISTCLQLERSVELTLKWRLCTLTQQSLAEPIVVCALGRLYNKVVVLGTSYHATQISLLEALLSRGKTKAPDDEPLIRHIRSIKETCRARLSLNPAFDKAKNTNQFADENLAPFCCPVVGLEMNGIHKFSIIWSCGHVLSEKALRTVATDHTCLTCGELYIDDDVVVLNPDDDETAVYAQRVVDRRAQRKAIKKAVKDEPVDDGDEILPVRAPVGHLIGKKAAQIVKLEPKTDGKRSAAPSTSVDVKTMRLPSGAEPTDIQLDPTKSNTFKSLFTTSDRGQQQPRAHWVTHNPQYY